METILIYEVLKYSSTRWIIKTMGGVSKIFNMKIWDVLRDREDSNMCDIIGMLDNTMKLILDYNVYNFYRYKFRLACKYNSINAVKTEINKINIHTLRRLLYSIISKKTCPEIRKLIMMKLSGYGLDIYYGIKSGIGDLLNKSVRWGHNDVVDIVLKKFNYNPSRVRHMFIHTHDNRIIKSLCEYLKISYHQFTYVSNIIITETIVTLRDAFISNNAFQNYPISKLTMIAVLHNRTEMVKFLLTQDILRSIPYKQYLCIAIRQNNIEMVNIILSDCRIKPPYRSCVLRKLSRIILSHATVDIIKLLLQHTISYIFIFKLILNSPKVDKKLLYMSSYFEKAIFKIDL